MTQDTKEVRPRYPDELRAETLEYLRIWAGLPGELFQASFPNEGENTHYSPDRQFMRSETIFLAERDAKDQKAKERKAVCEQIAKSEFSLERLFDSQDIDFLEALFYEVSAIQTIHHNQSISLEHRPGRDFEEQQGSSFIHLIKFFIIKSICCNMQNIEISVLNRNDHLVSDTELRLKHIEMEISNLLREAFALASNDESRMRAFQECILRRTLQAEEAVSPPDVAPELYAEREDRSERAEAFIRRVYAPWLGRGLLRPHLKALDKSAYQALYKQGIPDDFDTLLPKAPGQAAKRKGVLGDIEYLEERRTLAREGAKARYKGAPRRT
ncbi:MAG: hypothetical protein AAF367_01430 [Pseudomonadota bacterium]